MPRGREPNTDVLAILRHHAYIMPEYDGCWLWGGTRSYRGYGQVRVRVRGKVFNLLHRAVAYHFHGDPPKKQPFVCHSCNVRHCVNPNHLRYGSPKENSADAVRHGSANPSTKLSERGVKRVRMLLADGKLSMRQIAQRFGVSTALVAAIKHGRARKNVI